jgi:hypothetical protein
MEELTKAAVALMRSDEELIADARKGARVNNSIVGGMLAIERGRPRQYTEQAVRSAVEILEKLPRYRIENTSSSVVLGEYRAASEQEALDALAFDAGYPNYAEAEKVVPSLDGEILVTRLPE